MEEDSRTVDSSLGQQALVAPRPPAARVKDATHAGTASCLQSPHAPALRSSTPIETPPFVDFESVWETHQAGVAGWLRKKVKHFIRFDRKRKEVVREVLQETALRALRSWSRFAGRSSTKTWLISIAKKALAQHWRSQKIARDGVRNWRQTRPWGRSPAPQTAGDPARFEAEQLTVAAARQELASLDPRLVEFHRLILQGATRRAAASKVGIGERRLRQLREQARERRQADQRDEAGE